MARTRALGIIRLSKSPDPASTSQVIQREIIESFNTQQGMETVGFAIDLAVSAFKIPPERRKAVREWLDNHADDFDAIVYWRQDRLVRRAVDFLGIVLWCQQHGKKLYSATEGLGDVTQHAGMLLGFIQAWQSEGESRSISARVKVTQVQLAKQGRWRGGRVPYGFHAVKKIPGPGYELVPNEEKTAPVAREAARRVIAGESVHAVAVDFNRRHIPSADGKLWQAVVLRDILRNRALVEGIISPEEYGQLIAAVKTRGYSRQVRTLGRDSMLLDVVFCGQCGGKIYRWRHTAGKKRYYGRCRNEMKRGQVETPCNAPMIPYSRLEALVSHDLLSEHGDDLIETRVTNATRALRADDIDRELIELAAELAARRIDRTEFITRQTALLDEQEALEAADSTPEWKPTDETVRQRWERLSDAERRLWLLRIGYTWRVYKQESGEWMVLQDARSLATFFMRRERIRRP